MYDYEKKMAKRLVIRLSYLSSRETDVMSILCVCIILLIKRKKIRFHKKLIYTIK